MIATNPVRLILRLIRQVWNELIEIRSDTDAAKTIEEISSNIHFRGYNVWILICSAIIASIGLDLDSGAVIIGAMLISPLMSPILGVGLAVGINDQDLLFRALLNLGVFTVVSFIAAALYFLITPLGALTPELDARTTPTLLDVTVGFTGGVAGIISSSRSRITNAIPGVAIATALMPPLSTSAFGLVTGDWAVCFGAFYLFGINAIFISLATYLMVKYLRFPSKNYVSEQTQRTVSRTITISMLIIVLPSIYFLWMIWQDRRVHNRVKTIVEQVVASDSTEVLKWELLEHDSITFVKVFLAGQVLPMDSIEKYNKLLKEGGLTKYRFLVKQVSIDPRELERMKQRLSSTLLSMAERAPEQFASSTPTAEVDSTRQYTGLAEPLRKELYALFPDLKGMALGTLYQPRDTSGCDTLPTLHLSWKNRQQRTREEARIRDFVRQRLDVDTLVIVHP